MILQNSLRSNTKNYTNLPLGLTFKLCPLFFESASSTANAAFSGVNRASKCPKNAISPHNRQAHQQPHPSLYTCMSIWIPSRYPDLLLLSRYSYYLVRSSALLRSQTLALSSSLKWCLSRSSPLCVDEYQQKKTTVVKH